MALERRSQFKDFSIWWIRACDPNYPSFKIIWKWSTNGVLFHPFPAAATTATTTAASTTATTATAHPEKLLSKGKKILGKVFSPKIGVKFFFSQNNEWTLKNVFVLFEIKQNFYCQLIIDKLLLLNIFYGEICLTWSWCRKNTNKMNFVTFPRTF